MNVMSGVGPEEVIPELKHTHTQTHAHAFIENTSTNKKLKTPGSVKVSID